MIYFIQDESQLSIKIGYTSGDCAESRRSALQTGNGSKLRLLLTTYGDARRERELHERFASSRLVGEWFRPTADLLEFVVQESARQQQQCRQQQAPFDPWPMSIYLAGKMTRRSANHDRCWRDSIVEGEGCGPLYHDRFSMLRGFDPLPSAINNIHTYTGPFYFDVYGGHMGYSAHDHGAPTECFEPFVGFEGDGVRRLALLRACFRAVANSDLVFAWIDADDCHGTVTEVGWARAMGKRIWIAGPRPFRDMWFVYEQADRVSFAHKSPDVPFFAWLEKLELKLEAQVAVR